jgi:hypothetical protein
MFAVVDAMGSSFGGCHAVARGSGAHIVLGSLIMVAVACPAETAAVHGEAGWVCLLQSFQRMALVEACCCMC